MREWLPSGTIVARYQISSRLSANGLGEVYLAKDLSADREVALKLLPPELVREAAPSNRFIRIYSAITQLRHRNICQIHEGGMTENGRPYIAMEYIKGQSLDLLGYGHQLNLPELIEIAAQAAEAVEYAHQKGWLHLDIKPSNLMLTQGLKVLVLDFGQSLAFPPSISTALAENVRLTAGNAAYLSPELVTGEKPDQRADIFSLGVVLYELLAGHTPFVGLNVDEVLASVTLAEPLPLKEFRDDLPAELTDIVSRALAKDPAERYQTMGEMARDLRRLSLRRNEWFKAPDLSIDAVAEALGVGYQRGRSVADLRQSGTNRFGSGERIAPGSFIEDLKKAFSRLLESPLRRKGGRSGEMMVLTDRSFLDDARELLKSWWRRILVVSLMVAGLLWTIPLAIQLWNRDDQKKKAPSGLNVSLLTSVGKVTDAALSPDGRTVAYSVNEGEFQNLMIRETNSSEVRRIARAEGVELRGLTFTPDGRWVAFVRQTAIGSGELCRVPAGGGVEEKLSPEQVIGAPAFSPDGNRFAYVTINPENSETTLMLVESNGSRRPVARRQSPLFFYSGGLSWSPDGSSIACVTNDSSTSLYLRIVAVPVDGSGEKILNSGRWSEIERVAWMPDGSGLVVSAAGPWSRSMQLWRIELPSKEIIEITGVKSDYRGAGLSADARSLISVQYESLSNLWIAAGSDISRVQQLTRGVGDGVKGMAWTPDDRIVYVSTTGGRETIWITGLNVDDQKPLTVAPEGEAGGEYHPAVSPDGRILAYVVERPNGAYLWRSDLDRRNLKRLTDESMVFHPVFTADGSSIIYSVLRGNRRVIAQLDVNGGAPRTLIEKQSWRPVVSPDGAKLACNIRDQATGRWKIGILPVTGGEPLTVIEAPGAWHRVIRWMPDGQSVAYPETNGGITDIWVQPIAGGAPTRLTSSRASHIFDFAWSGSGQYIAFAQGWVSSDVVILTNFR
ncbi:MAG: serine/threonine-protein kinase [Acidobacteriota bacterium]|nr:MAG: serine/threonine-protein kinase [Acidobacteriota bacterium]